MLEKLIERHSCVFKLTRRDVRRCHLAPDLVLRMRRIASDDMFEVLNRVGKSFLLSGDASELITRVDLAVVDLQRAFETFARSFQLATALMNQAEVVMRRRIRRI